MHCMKDDDRAQLIAQLLVSGGADVNAVYAGKSIFAHAESISAEFHAVLQDAVKEREKELEEKERQKEAAAKAAVQEAAAPVAPVQSSAVAPAPQVAVDEQKQEATPAQVAAPSPVQPAAPAKTPEEIAAFAKQQAESLLKSRLEKRSEENREAESKLADVEVNEVIFEKVRSLQSLVSEEIPLQSVYGVININEMTETVISLVKSALPAAFTAIEISNLNNSLKLSAEMLKNLFAAVKKFAALFDEAEMKEILANSLTVQSTVKSLVAVIKQINTSPNDNAARESLFSNAKQLVDSVYKFFKACESATNEYINSTSQQCAEVVSRIISSLAAEAKDRLDKDASDLALSTLKVFFFFTLFFFKLFNLFPLFVELGI